MLNSLKITLQEALTFNREDALLPQDQCHLLANDDDLSEAEFTHITRLTEQLKQGDNPEFEDWTDVKARLL